MKDGWQSSTASPILSETGRRLGTAVLFVVTLGVVAPIVWLAIWFLFMSLAGNESTLMVLGYAQIGLLPISVMLGIGLGMVLGLIQRGQASKRWLVGAAVIVLSAVVINGGLWLLLW